MRLLVTALGVTADPTGLGVYAQMVAPLLQWLDPEVAIVSWSGARLGVGAQIDVGPLPPDGGLQTAIRRVLWANTRLAQVVRASRAEAVLHLLPEVGVAPVPQLAVVHDVAPLVAETTWRQRLYFQTVVASSVRRASSVIADSGPTRRDVVRLLRVPTERVVVVPAGVDLAFFRPVDAQRPARPYLIAVGSHAPHKRLDVLLRAFARSDIARTHDLVIVGPYSRYTTPLQGLARELGVTDRVQWRRYVERDALPALYSGADAYVSVSAYEGFGLPALEALACGTPCLLSDVGIARELLSDVAVVIASASIGQVATALGSAAALPRGAAARAVAERFPWERTARELLAVAARSLEACGIVA